MQDKVELIVDNAKIENFLSYNIDSDLYVPADAFSFEFVNPDIEITTGKICKVIVNGSLEHIGIIEKITKSYDKNKIILRAEGRDLLGLLVDTYVDEFFSVENMKLKDLAERLLKKVPYINRKQIIYQENIKINKKSTTKVASFDEPHNLLHIEPGKTIFEVLKDYSMSRSLMFYSLPDGTFVFGKPKTGGQPEFYIYNLKSNPVNNNVISGEMINDITERYSKIIVLGQQQSLESFGSDTQKFNTKAVIEDKTFPFYKPYVVTNNNDEKSPQLYAKMLLEQMRFKGFQLNYKVKGHSQRGKNWTINEICHVKDEILGIEGDYLIYQRSFIMSKEGVYTTIKLSYPGVVQ